MKQVEKSALVFMAYCSYAAEWAILNLFSNWSNNDCLRTPWTLFLTDAVSKKLVCLPLGSFSGYSNIC